MRRNLDPYLEVLAVEDLVASMDSDKAARFRAEAGRSDPGQDIGPEAERFHLLLAELGGNPVLAVLLPILSGLISDVFSARNPRLPDEVRRALWSEITDEHALIAEAVIAGDLHATRKHLTAHLTTSHRALSSENQ